MSCSTNVNSVNTGTVSSEYSSLLSSYESSLSGLNSTENSLTMGNITQDTPLLMNLYSTEILPQLEESQAQANTYQRSHDVQDISNLGGAATAAIRRTNAQGSNLLDSMYGSAQEGLAAGSQLDANSTRRISKGVQSDWASRGLGDSNPAALSEAMGLYDAGTSELAQRQNYANTVYGRESDLTNSALSVVEKESSVPSAASSWLTGLESLGYNNAQSGQSSAYDIMNTSYNANAAANISESNNRSSIYSSALSY